MKDGIVLSYLYDQSLTGPNKVNIDVNKNDIPASKETDILTAITFFNCDEYCVVICFDFNRPCKKATHNFAMYEEVDVF